MSTEEDQVDARDPCGIENTQCGSIEALLFHLDKVSVGAYHEGLDRGKVEEHRRKMCQKGAIMELFGCYLRIRGIAAVRQQEQRPEDRGWKVDFLGEQIREQQMRFFRLWSNYVELYKESSVLKTAFSVKQTAYSAEVDTEGRWPICDHTR